MEPAAHPTHRVTRRRDATGNASAHPNANDVDVDAVADAVAVLQRGGLVAVPTETVYGLAARGLDEDAVRAIYAAKGRPADNPVILHVASVDDAWPLFDVDAVTAARIALLARTFWPGPLTLVATASALVPDVVRAGLPKVAVRVPAHPVARAIARALGEPFAAPSANVSGRPSPTTADDVLKTLDGKIDLVIDGGPCRAGIESTVVDVAGPVPRLLRPGALSVLELRRFLPDLTVRAPGKAAHVDDASPGLRHRHYAPDMPTLLLSRGDPRWDTLWSDVDVGVVVTDGFAAERGPRRGPTWTLQREPAAYAARLFAVLYQAERAAPARLVVEDVPVDDAWLGVRDRLLRATSA